MVFLPISIEQSSHSLDERRATNPAIPLLAPSVGVGEGSVKLVSLSSRLKRKAWNGATLGRLVPLMACRAPGRENMAKPGKAQPGKAARKSKTAEPRSAGRVADKRLAVGPHPRKTPSRGEIFRTGLRPNAANFAALTPASFLAQSAEFHADRVAVIHG